MSVVHQPVEDRVGQGGIADLGVPLGDWELAGEDGRAALIAVAQISRKSRRSSSFMGAMAQSSTIKTSMRDILSSRRGKLPSARAIARSRNN